MPELPDPKHRQHPWKNAERVEVIGQRSEVESQKSDIGEQQSDDVQNANGAPSSLVASHPSLPASSHHFPSSLPRYAELHVTSNFTFLTGASHPDELVQQAATL